MLTQAEVTMGGEDWSVKSLAPLHDWSRVAFYVLDIRCIEDQGTEGCVVVHDNRTSTCEPLYDLHACCLGSSNVYERFWFPDHSINNVVMYYHRYL